MTLPNPLVFAYIVIIYQNLALESVKINLKCKIVRSKYNINLRE